MNFIASLLALINWNVRRRTHTSGGNDSVSDDSPELSEPLPEVAVKPVVFGDGVCFSDGESAGSWIIADDDSYIDWRDL
jgi:hypothetical protein